MEEARIEPWDFLEFDDDAESSRMLDNVLTLWKLLSPTLEDIPERIKARVTLKRMILENRKLVSEQSIFKRKNDVERNNTKWCKTV